MREWIVVKLYVHLYFVSFVSVDPDLKHWDELLLSQFRFCKMHRMHISTFTLRLFDTNLIFTVIRPMERLREASTIPHRTWKFSKSWLILEIYLKNNAISRLYKLLNWAHSQRIRGSSSSVCGSYCRPLFCSTLWLGGGECRCEFSLASPGHKKYRHIGPRHNPPWSAASDRQ